MVYIIIASVFIVIGLIILLYYIHVNNTDVELRNLYKKKLEEIEVIHDKMFKIIKQKTSAVLDYKEGFSKIYSDIMMGRYNVNSDKGEIMKWIQEDNPNFDSSMYMDLMNSIEVERVSFSSVQTILLDIIREHNNLLEKIPSKFFIKNKETLFYEPITSTITKEIRVKKVDDQIELF